MKSLYNLMCSMIILGEWTQAKPSPLDIIEINFNIREKSRLPPNSPVIGNYYGNGNGNGNIGNGNGVGNIGNGNGNGNIGKSNGNFNVGDGNGNANKGNNNGNNVTGNNNGNNNSNGNVGDGNGNKGNNNGNNVIGDNIGNNNLGDNNRNNQKVLIKHRMSGKKCPPKDTDTDEIRKENFKKLAGDDGILSYQEFVNGIKEYIAHTGLKRLFLLLAPTFFKIVDFDKNGSLTYEEAKKRRCAVFTLADRIIKKKGFSNRDETKDMKLKPKI